MLAGSVQAYPAAQGSQFAVPPTGFPMALLNVPSGQAIFLSPPGHLYPAGQTVSFPKIEQNYPTGQASHVYPITPFFVKVKEPTSHIFGDTEPSGQVYPAPHANSSGVAETWPAGQK